MKIGKRVAAVMAGAGLTLALGIGPALPAGADEAAIVERHCPDGTFLASVGGFVFTYCFDEVQTASSNAVAHFHGSLVNPATAPDRATTLTGFPCNTTYGVTTDTRLVVAPTGEVNGTCRLPG
jgi:hypothetical protein